MKLFKARQLSEAEVIGRTRKRLRNSKRDAWIRLVLAGVWTCFGIGILRFARQVIANCPEYPTNSHDMFQAGVWTGVILGAVAMSGFAKSLMLFGSLCMRSRSDQRDQLLVTYYEQLHPAETRSSR